MELMGALPRKRFLKSMGGSNRMVFRLCMETKGVMGESRGWSCGRGGRGCSALCPLGLALAGCTVGLPRRQLVLGLSTSPPCLGTSVPRNAEQGAE